MKKLLAALLTLVMLVSAVPVSAQTDGGASAASAPATASQPVAKKVTYPEPERYGRTLLAQYPNGAALVDAYDCYEKAVKNPDPNYMDNNWIYFKTPLTDVEISLVKKLFNNDFALSTEYGLITLTSGTQTSAGTTDKKYKAVAAVQNEDAAKRVAATKAVVEQIIAKVNPAWSDYDKALYLHDYVVSHVSYRQEGYHQTAYGALVDGHAVCAGYARAYQLLLNSVGIPAFYISGTVYSAPHAWTYVKLDGNWYQTDVTFDDPVGGHGSFHYNYFNLTDKKMSGNEEMVFSHTADNTYWVYENDEIVDYEYPLPACDSTELAYTKNDYYVAEKLNAKTWKALLQFASGKNLEEVFVCVDNENNPEGYTNISINDWLEKNIKDANLPDCLHTGWTGNDVSGPFTKLVIEHTYSNAADTTCNTCGIKRQLKCHAWVKGTCRLCGMTMPSSITQVNVPTNQQVKQGEKIRLDAQADGVDLTFRWYIKRADEMKYTLREEGKEWIYSRDMTDSLRDSYAYCIITDKFGNEVKTKTVVVRMAASIISEPATAVYAPLGKEASVKIKVAGDGLKYQWYLKNAGAKNFTKSSITSATYSATMREAAKGRQIYCEITDKYGNKVKTKTFTLREGVAITTQPATVAYASLGKKATVKITASGEGLKYQWYVKNAGAKNFAKSSITSATYSTTMGEKAKNRQVYCAITDKYGNKVKTKTFTLRESVSITTQPKTVTVKKNATAKVTLKASGDGLTYQWYIKNATATKFSKSSVTTATYSTKMTDKAKNRQIYCVIKDKYGNTVKTVTVKLNMQ